MVTTLNPMSCVFYQIKPLDKSPPEVVKMLPLWKAEALGDGRSGIFLSSRELKARDGDSREDELIFCVVRPPYFGYLENITTGWRAKRVFASVLQLSSGMKTIEDVLLFSVAGGFVTRCFSQVELSRRSIAYIINPDGESLADSLELTVSDPLGNTGPSHT